MTIVRIVADDLTGALDAAAPLSRRTGTLPVFWERAAIEASTGSCALDSDSRDGEPSVPWWLHLFDDADIAFKKIDSLLRGNTAHEIAACLASGGFQSALIAPAFPAQQRITRAGRQHWRADPAEPWQVVTCDLAAECRAQGITLRLAASAGAVAGSGFFLCDAASEAGLQALVAAGRGLPGPVLWCGSAGLARALAGTPPASVTPRLEPPLLVVIGSHHPVTLAQIRGLTGHAPELVVEVRPEQQSELGATLRALGDALTRHHGAALVMAVPDGSGAGLAGPFFDRVLGALVADVERPRSLVVSGGATLHRLVGVLGARSLLVTGEPLPGVPCSMLQGGLWDGAVVISKSGGFGDSRLLIRLADSVKGDRHE